MKWVTGTSLTRPSHGISAYDNEPQRGGRGRLAAQGLLKGPKLWIGSDGEMAKLGRVYSVLWLLGGSDIILTPM